MNDEQELETRLRDAFRHGSLPAAPASLQNTLDEVAAAPVIRNAGGRTGRAGVGRRPWGALAVAAVLLIGGAVAVSIGNRGFGPVLDPSTSATTDPSTGAETRLVFEPQWSSERPFSADDLAIEVGIIEQRIQATGVADVRIATDDLDRIVIDLPASVDPARIRALVGQLGLLAFVGLDDVIVEIGTQLDPTTLPPLYEGPMEASVVVGQEGQPALEVRLTRSGATRFAEYTRTHIGSTFAIVLDGTVIAVPVIQSEIPDGTLRITFASPGEPERLAEILGSAVLPVPLVEVFDGPVPSASAPLAADPPIRCEPPLRVEGPQLDCESAVHMALAILPAGHPTIALVTFNYGCPDLAVGTTGDCLVQMYGTVVVTFVDDSPPTIIAVGGPRPSILPSPNIPDASR